MGDPLGSPIVKVLAEITHRMLGFVVFDRFFLGGLTCLGFGFDFCGGDFMFEILARFLKLAHALADTSC